MVRMKREGGGKGEGRANGDGVRDQDERGAVEWGMDLVDGLGKRFRAGRPVSLR